MKYSLRAFASAGMTAEATVLNLDRVYVENCAYEKIESFAILLGWPRCISRSVTWKSFMKPFSCLRRMACGMAQYRAQFGNGFVNVGPADMESAVGEALANSAEHGAKNGGAIDVRCHLEGACFVIDVKAR